MKALRKDHLAGLPGHIHYRSRKFPCTIQQFNRQGMTLQIDALSLPDGLNVDVEFYAQGEHWTLNGDILNSCSQYAQFHFKTPPAALPC